MRVLLLVLSAVLALIPAAALAVPATVTVTVTGLSDDATGGAVDGFRLYRGCDLATQSKGGALADPAVVGGSYSFAGDTDEQYQLCAVAFNSAGEGPFANVVTIRAENVVVPPGGATVILDCLFDPTRATAECVQTNAP